MSDFDPARLDELIHSQLRLAVMAVLAGVDKAEFSFRPLTECSLTDAGRLALTTYLSELEALLPRRA